MLPVQMLKDRSAVIASTVIPEMVHLVKVNVFHVDYCAAVSLTFLGRKKYRPGRESQKEKRHFMHMHFSDLYGINNLHFLFLQI